MEICEMVGMVVLSFKSPRAIGHQLRFYTDATLGCGANMLTTLNSVQSNFGPGPLHI